MAGVCTFIAGSDVGKSAQREYYHFCITGVPESSCPTESNDGVPVGTYYANESDCRAINDGNSYISQCIGNDWQSITSTGKIMSDRSTPEVALNKRGDLVPFPIVLQCKRVEETCCPPGGVDTGFCQCSRSFPGGAGKIPCNPQSNPCSGGATCSLSTAPDVDCPKDGPGAGQQCFCATTCSGHCPTNSICQAGVCAGLSPSGGSACGTGTPCPSAEEQCQDGQCYAVQGACTDRGAAAPCRLGFLCDDDNLCIKGCGDSSDCPNGADGTADTPLCYSTMCVPEECEQDAQCAAAKFGDKSTCNAGVCVQICGSPEDKACPAGQACSHHKPSVCGKVCSNSAECGDYEFCDKASLTAPSGTCVRGCRGNTDCRLGFACWQDGKCYSACKTASDCGKTEVCADGACVFDPDPGSDSKSLWILWIVLAGVAFGVIVAIIVRLSRRHKALSTAQSMAEAQSSNT